MSYETDTAGRYRLRALQLRLMAKKYQDPETARIIEWVAQEYEWMALRHEVNSQGSTRPPVAIAGEERAV